jgi:hypothetical protein
MTRRTYEIDLDESFQRELDRAAGELRVTPGEALEQITGELAGKTFASGIVVATADGARSVITSRSIEIS